MKRFVQPDTWQLDFAEPVADILGSEQRTTIRQRLMKRLHKVFSKEPDTTPVINIHYPGARCTVTVNANGIYVKAQEGTAYYLFSDFTTLSHLVDQINSYTVLTASLVDEKYAPMLAKGLFDDTIILPGQTYLSYPTSLLWQEMQTASFALTEQLARIADAEAMLYFHSANSTWLDLWANGYFSIPRHLGEIDSNYLARAIIELLQPTQNNIALEKIVEAAFGIRVRIVDAMLHVDELPPPYTEADARNRFLLDMAIDSSVTETDAEALITRIKTFVRKYKSAGTDFVAVPLRKLHQPAESITTSEIYSITISTSNLVETLQPGPIRVGAGWRVGTPGLKVGMNDAVKEQALVKVLLASDNTVVNQYLIGG